MVNNFDYKDFKIDNLHFSVLTPLNPKGYVIFVHGGPGSNGTYFEEFLKKSIEYQSSRIGWIIYDQRGCGRSKCTDLTEINHQINLNDLKMVVDKFLTGRYISYPILAVMGHSYGAWLSYECFVSESESRLPLILIALGKTLQLPRNRTVAMDLILAKLEAPEKYDKMMDELRSSDLPYWKWGPIIRSFYHNEKKRDIFYWGNLNARELYNNIKLNSRFKDSSEIYKSVSHSIRLTEDLRKGINLKQLSIKCLWLLGAHDFLMGGENEVMNEENEIVIFENSGHYPHIEEIDKFLKILEEFLEI